MEMWKEIGPGTAATCGHVDTRSFVPCSNPAAWRLDTACGCGAIHSELLRCHRHRIADLEEEVARVKKTVEGVVRYARRLNPDIRTDEECVLFAAGYQQNPRDEGDELWEALNAIDVAERN